jgi:hypothetical protein
LFNVKLSKVRVHRMQTRQTLSIHSTVGGPNASIDSNHHPRIQPVFTETAMAEIVIAEQVDIACRTGNHGRGDGGFNSSGSYLCSGDGDGSLVRSMTVAAISTVACVIYKL